METEACALRRPLTERITDLYLITMLLIFPLFPGFSGYQAITLSKFVFFLAATGLWLAALLVALWKQRQRVVFGPVQLCAAVYLFFCVLSWALSPYRTEALLGAGRYDGLLTTAVCVLAFLGVSLFGRPRLRHAQWLALATVGCAVVALLQLGGRNPLGLFPRELSYYDAGVQYSGVFLGTIGNTNLLDAVLCLTLPVLFALYLCGSGAGFLLPVLLCVPILCKAGGDGCKLALALTALVGLPLLLWELPRVRRALRGGGALLLCGAASALWQPGPAAGLRFVWTPSALWLSAGAAVLLGLSFCPAPALSKAALRRIFCGLSALALLLGLGAALLAPADRGTLYELGQVLRGQAEDSFGSSRIGIWRACLALVPERPLLGGGPGTLALRLSMEFSRYVPETGQTLRSFVDNAHNIYLGALVNTGALGLAALLALGVLALLCAWRRREQPLSAALLTGAFCCAVQEFFGLGLVPSAPLLWIVLGLLCAPAAPSSWEVPYAYEE